MYSGYQKTLYNGNDNYEGQLTPANDHDSLSRVRPQIMINATKSFKAELIPFQGFVLHLWIILQPDVLEAVVMRFVKYSPWFNQCVTRVHSS